MKASDVERAVFWLAIAMVAGVVVAGLVLGWSLR